VLRVSGRRVNISGSAAPGDVVMVLDSANEHAAPHAYSLPGVVIYCATHYFRQIRSMLAPIATRAESLASRALLRRDVMSIGRRRRWRAR